MIGTLLRFEWSYHLRQAPTAIFALGFLLLGFAVGGLGGFGEAQLHRNGPWAITYSLGILSLGTVFAVMILAAHAVLRDQVHRMAPIIHSTAISERRYLAVRFAGAWTTAVAVFSPTILGYWIGTRMPWVDPEQLGRASLASDLSAYLWPWLVLVLPNLLWVSVALFAIAAGTRSRRLTYVGALLIYALYMAASVFLNSPLMAGSNPASADSLTLAALLDPFGLAAFLEQTQYWPVEDRNRRLLGLQGNFLANRALWLGLSLLLLAVLGRVFRFREEVGRGRRNAPESRTSSRALADSRPPAQPEATYRPVAIAAPNWRGGLGTLVARVRLELRLLLRSRPFWLLLLVWIFILAMELVPRVLGGLEYGAALYPTTVLLVSWLRTPLMLVGTLALVFYGGEVAASDRDARLEDLIDATGMSSAVRLVAKLIALCCIPLLLIVVGLAVAVGCQVAGGYNRYDAATYLGVFYFQGLRLCLLASLALAIQTWTGRKYLGMALTLLAFLSTSGLAMRAGLHHPLLRFASAPAVDSTDMAGYAPSAGAFHLFMVYWAAIAFLGLWAAHGLGARGAALSGGRLRSLRIRWGRWSWVLVTGALMVAVATGGWLYHQTCGVVPCRSQADDLDRRAAYEHRYQQFAELPDPTVVAMALRVDLFPEEHRYRLENRLLLENETPESLDQMFFTTLDGVHVEELEVEGATLEHRDEALGVWWFRFEEPLDPGERRAMRYTLDSQNRAFDLGNSWSDPDIVSNGTYLMEAFFAPRIGYRRSLEIESNFERRRRGLAAKVVESPGDGEHLAARTDDGHDWIDFEAVVSTSAGQIAVAPGRLLRQWRADGRHHFHYRSDGPMSRVVAIASARYDIAHLEHRGVEIEVYYHREHAQNVDHILEMAKLALDHGESSLGPYGRDHLRLLEVPAHWPFGGYALPGTVILPARGTFLVDLRDDETFDLVAKRVVHEVAHQWWGHRVHPVSAPGGTLLVETLTKYAERAVLEQTEDRRSMRSLLEHEHRRYQAGRASDPEPEVPLARVENQAYLFYGKGYLAMNALRRELGAEALQRILRRFAVTWAHPHPAPRAEDLLDALEADASPRVRTVIDDWFRHIRHWRLRVLSADSEKLADGTWETHLVVETRKYETDDAGVVHEVPIEDWIEVGLFASDDVLDREGELHHERVHFTASETSLTLRTATRPRTAGIDPWTVLLDEDRLDNLAPIRDRG